MAFVRHLRVVRDYYEELWERLPADLSPPDFERRRAFLLAELRSGDRVLDLGCGERRVHRADRARGRDG